MGLRVRVRADGARDKANRYVVFETEEVGPVDGLYLFLGSACHRPPGQALHGSFYGAGELIRTHRIGAGGARRAQALQIWEFHRAILY